MKDLSNQLDYLPRANNTPCSVTHQGPDKIEDITTLSTMTKNALKHIGISFCTDLALLSERDLHLINYVGRTGRLAIIKYCNDHHIKLSRVSYFKNGLPRV